MAIQRISIFGHQQDAPARKAAGSLRLAPTVKNDVFLNALLEMPTTQPDNGRKIAPRGPFFRARPGRSTANRSSTDSFLFIL